MSKNRRIPIIKPGFFSWFRKGQKAKGLDLGKVIREELAYCGYPCIQCGDTVCIDDCDESSLINPDIRKLLEDLTARIEALENP